MLSCHILSPAPRRRGGRAQPRRRVPAESLPPVTPKRASARVESGPWHAAAVAPARSRTLLQALARLRGAPWVPLDALLVALVGGLAVAETERVASAGAHAALFLALGFLVGLYDWNVWWGRRALLTRAAVASVLGSLLSLPLSTWRTGRLPEPMGALALAAGTLAVSLLPRYGLWAVLRLRPQRVLFVGRSPLQERVHGLLEEDPQRSYLVVGTWEPGAGEALVEACARLEADEVVLPNRAADLLETLVPALACLPLGCRVRPAADFCEDVFRFVPVEHVAADWLLSRGFDTSDHLAEGTKRLSDVALAALFLLPALPLMGLVALAVRLDDGGPALYRQWRVGRYGRLFRILKFRTMRPGAEAHGAQWASADDARQTRAGRFLRRTRLDELPQLVNILRGEMSFVGPRPERPEFIDELEGAIPFYGWRHLLRPGLTGWAQIHYRYGASVDDARRKLEYDLYYLRHYSSLGDLGVVLRTLTLLWRGAR